MQYQNLLFRKEDRTAVITLNRPEVLNSISEQMLIELEDAIKVAGEDLEVRVIVLTGAGRAFCVGGDIKEFQKATPEWIEHFNRRHLQLWEKMERLRKPIIAAVNGHANLETIQACDIIIASEDAKFGLPEVNIGVCPGAGITIRLPRLTSRLIAKELLFVGEWITASEAWRIGLVNKVVPKDKLMDETMALAGKLAKRAPLAIGAAKACVNIGAEMDLDQGIEYQLLESLKMFYTEDLKEGLKAFIEKREPEFHGK